MAPRPIRSTPPRPAGVDIANRRGIIEVSEVTRTGTPVRTARFMASRVVALVEYPADSPKPD